MSHRLQVLIPSELDAQLEKAAQRSRMSKGEWVRRALREALHQPARSGTSSPVDRLASLGAPTADIEQMLSEIEAGRF
jgi:metal-responsive CopG/Arc/MetJ family transcriptional regulator